jgi:hypothetical protein
MSAERAAERVRVGSKFGPKVLSAGQVNDNTSMLEKYHTHDCAYSQYLAYARQIALHEMMSYKKVQDIYWYSLLMSRDAS